MQTTIISPDSIEYPCSDGLPMAESTVQYEYLVMTKDGLEVEFADEPVFIAGDIFWYPVEGRPDIRLAPDVLVAFGRPKGHRGSYQQWNEGGIAPQVVFEILSPGNRRREMQEKLEFYEQHGVEEYYVYDPPRKKLRGWLRREDRLTEIADMQGWVSPRMGIRFELINGEMRLYHSDGSRFETFPEVYQRAADSARDADQARKESSQAKRNATRAKQQADAAKQEADAAKQQLQALRDKLRAAGIDPDQYP